MDNSSKGMVPICGVCGAVLVCTRCSKDKSKRLHTTMRLPESTIQQLDKIARDYGLSRSKLVNAVLRHYTESQCGSEENLGLDTKNNS